MHETVAVGICLRQQFAHMKGRKEIWQLILAH